MATAEISNRLTFGGINFIDEQEVAADGVSYKEATMAVAKIGALTTRTDDNTGTLTMASGHAITTGQIIDIFWDGGCQRSVTVGTVASLSVPFDSGVGDNLPADETAITAQVQQEEEILITGDNVVAIGAKMTRKGAVIFKDASDVELLAIVRDARGGYQWYDGNGVTNPLASDDVAIVTFSNGSSDGTNDMVAGAAVT